jgi:hypothetical protein
LPRLTVLFHAKAAPDFHQALIPFTRLLTLRNTALSLLALVLCLPVLAVMGSWLGWNATSADMLRQMLATVLPEYALDIAATVRDGGYRRGADGLVRPPRPSRCLTFRGGARI